MDMDSELSADSGDDRGDGGGERTDCPGGCDREFGGGRDLEALDEFADLLSPGEQHPPGPEATIFGTAAQLLGEATEPKLRNQI